jgi:hypothetical protein
MRRAALVAALALAGCGGGDDGGGGKSQSAMRLLDRGFATDVDSGVVTLEAELEVEGGQVEGPFRLELEGPFRSTGGPTTMPELDFAFRATGAGQEFGGRVIATRENSWVEYEGESYEVGEEFWSRLLESLENPPPGEPETFAEAGVDPLDWVRDVEEAGEEEVGGVATTRVTGRLDPGRMLRDSNRLPGARLPDEDIRQVDEALGEVDFEAWIGADDIWRRVLVETDFDVPEKDRDAFGGLRGGSLSFDLRLDDPNEPVEIEGPTEARPIDELLRRLGIPPEALLGPGFTQPTPG